MRYKNLYREGKHYNLTRFLLMTAIGLCRAYAFKFYFLQPPHKLKRTNTFLYVIITY